MLDLRLVRILAPSAVFLTFNSCGKTNPTASSPNSSSTIASFKPYSSVKSALFFDLANGFRTANPPNDRKMRTSKSREACEVKQQFEITLENRRNVEGRLCLIENSVVGSSVPGKYTVNLKKNEQRHSFKLYIEGTSSQFQVHLCEDYGLEFSLNVLDRNANGIKGSVKQKFQNIFATLSAGIATEGYINFDATFDTTTKGRTVLDSKHAGIIPASTEQGNAHGEYKLLYSSKVDINDAGLSSIVYSSKEIRSAPSAASEINRGASKSNSSFGQAIVKFNDGSSNWTRRGSVNQAGDKIANNTVSTDVQVNLSEVPAELSDTFSVDGPSGWDCQTTSEIDVEITDDLTKLCSIGPDEWAAPVCSPTDQGEDVSSVSP
jgi:hypothetical protein